MTEFTTAPPPDEGRLERQTGEGAQELTAPRRAVVTDGVWPEGDDTMVVNMGLY